MDPAAAKAYREVMAVDVPATLSAAEQRSLEHRFGEVWARPGLGRRERRLVTIACVAFVITPQPIADHVYAALKRGDFTIEELLEVVLHFAVYCGRPKSSNLEMYVRQAWTRVQEERGDAAPLPSRTSDDAELGSHDWEARVARGAEEFRNVNLVPAPTTDSPYQHAGILGFVFGHIWQRPGLSRHDRRFLTVACVGLCEAPIPISAHVGSALGSGDITTDEMSELILQFRAYDGDRRADAPLEAAETVWGGGDSVEA